MVSGPLGFTDFFFTANQIRCDVKQLEAAKEHTRWSAKEREVNLLKKGEPSYFPSGRK